MRDLIIKSNGIKTERFYIPPFELNKGEIVVLFLYAGEHIFDLKMYLKDVFNGSIKHENIIINQKLTFVERIYESTLRKIFYPLTVGEYLKKNANLESIYYKKIYEKVGINPKTKANSLSGSLERQLSLYSTLSKTNNISLDLLGESPLEAQETYEIVKDATQKGGSAILLDHTSEMKNDCSKYIEIELLK